MSYDSEREDITKKYDHDHMIIAISNNAQGFRNNVGQSKLLHLYVPQEYAIIVKKAREIARREGRSLSNLVMDLLRDYVRIHEPGNPQLPLTRFVEGAEDSKVCSVEGCDAEAAFLVYVDHGKVIEKMRLCEKHLRDLRQGWLGDKRVYYKSLSWRRIPKK